MRRFGRYLSLLFALAACAAAGGVSDAAAAQSSASSYSYGTYDPVQAAINRNSMNEAILRQSGHLGRRPASRYHRPTRHGYRHHRR
jgi:hypothetical protein